MELELLRRAIERAAVWRVRVRGHEWAEVLPALVELNGHHAFDVDRADVDYRPIAINPDVEADDVTSAARISA